MGIRPASSEDTKDTPDVAWELAKVVGAGGIGMMGGGTIPVVPD